MWVGVLGPTVASDAQGRPIPMQAAKHRALLAALALDAGRPVSAEVLVDTIWGPDAPPGALGTLQTYVSVVRRALEPDLPARSPSSYLTSSDLGYVLHADIDAEEFTRTVREVHDAISSLTGSAVPVAADPGRATAQLQSIDAARTRCRGFIRFSLIGGS